MTLVAEAPDAAAARRLAQRFVARRED